MPRVKYIKSDINLLARIMRAEALGEGNLGMLMVGNVGVNRVLAGCCAVRAIVFPVGFLLDVPVLLRWHYH